MLQHFVESRTTPKSCTGKKTKSNNKNGRPHNRLCRNWILFSLFFVLQLHHKQTTKTASSNSSSKGQTTVTTFLSPHRLSFPGADSNISPSPKTLTTVMDLPSISSEDSLNISPLGIASITSPLPLNPGTEPSYHAPPHSRPLTVSLATAEPTAFTTDNRATPASSACLGAFKRSRVSPLCVTAKNPPLRLGMSVSRSSPASIAWSSTHPGVRAFLKRGMGEEERRVRREEPLQLSSKSSLADLIPEIDMLFFSPAGRWIEGSTTSLWVS